MNNVNLKDRIRIMQQLLLLSVIVGRWLMPREGITRDELSQLLLINIGTAADILELFEAFNEPAVRENNTLRAVILCLWQASLVQFCFNKTATRNRRSNHHGDHSSNGSTNSSSSSDGEGSGHSSSRGDANGSAQCLCLSGTKCKGSRCRQKVCSPACSCSRVCCLLSRKRPYLCCETELWAIGMSLLLQDMPFVVLRLTLIAHFNLYRSIVIFDEAYSQLKRPHTPDAESQI